MKEKKKKCDIRPIESKDYPTPAERPKNSRLVVDKLEQKYELKMPRWDYALRLCVEE